MNDNTNTSASGIYLGDDNDASRNGLESVPPATENFAALTHEQVAAGMLDRELLIAIYVSQKQTQEVVEGIIATAQANPMISGMLGL